MYREVDCMTDEQFKTYNQLLELIDEMIEDTQNEEKRKEYKQKKNDILLKK